MQDVDELKSAELVQRKMLLALRTVEPDRVNNALAGLYKGFAGVRLLDISPSTH